MTIFKPSQLRARTGAILDKAKQTSVYVERNGTLLVITKAQAVTSPTGPYALALGGRANMIESFYDSTKTW
jgi:hypothetical protein